MVFKTKSKIQSKSKISVRRSLGEGVGKILIEKHSLQNSPVAQR